MKLEMICTLFVENWRFIVVIVEERGGNLVCAGSIVDKNHVLTAAHCIVEDDLNDLLILSNTIYSKPGIGSEESRHHIENARMHQDYVTTYLICMSILKVFSTIDFW